MRWQPRFAPLIEFNRNDSFSLIIPFRLPEKSHSCSLMLVNYSGEYFGEITIKNSKKKLLEKKFKKSELTHPNWFLDESAQIIVFLDKDLFDTCDDYYWARITIEKQQLETKEEKSHSLFTILNDHPSPSNNKKSAKENAVLLIYYIGPHGLSISNIDAFITGFADPDRLGASI